MARRKVTFVYETGEREPWFLPVEERVVRLGGVDRDSVTVEDLLDPPFAQKFIVEVESPADVSAGRLRSDQLAYFLHHPLTLDDRRKVTVTEVTDG